MKKVIGFLAAAAVLGAAAFGIIAWQARSDASAAIEAYNTSAAAFNEQIESYNEAVAQVEEANEELQGVLDAAQAVLDEGKKAYEPKTREKLKSAVRKASEVFVEVPARIDPFEKLSLAGSWRKAELEKEKMEAEAAQEAVEKAVEKIPPLPQVPDYQDQISAVRKAQKAYTDSVQKLANVTAPADSFVRERLRKIDTVVQAQAVTEKNDPNRLLGKKGGYKGCVYFLDSRIDRDLLPADAFRKEEEAEKDGKSGTEETDTAATGASAAAAEGASFAGASSSAFSNPAAAETSETAAATAETGETAADAAAATGDTAAATAAETAAPTAETGETGADSAAESAAASATAAETAAAFRTETSKMTAAPADEGPDIDVVMIGTAGGGAVEIYTSADDANARDEYLAFFEGSVMDPGAHTVEGTCVIRTSKYLEEEEQEQLTEKVRQALLAVE